MTILLGLLLAFACALTTNVGFLYKHRGARSVAPVDMRRPVRSARALFSCRLFTIGMIIACGSWLFHIAAMAFAPLSLVQSVLAGGVVLLAVMAERMFGIGIGRRQWVGLAAMATGLIMLGLTLPAAHGADSRFSIPAMIAFEGGLIAVGTLLIMGPRIGAPTEHHGVMLGAASGILFGVSDVAIKAISGLVGSHGLLGFSTPWTLVCVAASVVAFFSSAKSFQDGEAVPVIAVTGTAANLSGIIGGILVFGDPLSANPLTLVAQCGAFVLLLLAAYMMPAPVRATGMAAATA
jgi:multidrug transporter EmrE-like cation transporter